ncbi:MULTISPECIES: SDR family oxidoreductase [Thermomonospora]|uniref:Short-chain dehydrogenase/reductase SDR n=1 Tax=Thermomonospora curvata (strain ATCC 19995 / DSM 43183 / JCM 3096 / KCTC 9072 / NBRC 15933 / NCIMB 10081 / Henssen B9) TaxID=471852 RepID=D1ACJ6_THECD|nr:MULTISPECIES: SDR family oxidoreductase [Thermomonospora]ACY99255.1 short-chain dehydrogenase/reductase SDR [Thermomonospora curvata DSM 43183]PKK12318.1 MAG: NAD(P)-dependent oxidoreductase [Thermomonospora sp. CIF 1]
MSKVIAITGGARGIGYATARTLVAKGAKVAIGDIDETAVKEAGERLDIPALKLDVTDRDSFTAFLEAVEDRLGRLDVLVNNAGIMPIGPVTGESDADARRCLDVNVHGVMLGTKLALERMLPRADGHIINIASVAGVLPTPGLALYNASKAAVVAFTEATRLEVRDRGIKVGAVLPSFTDTELIAGTRSPRGQRNCRPEEIAAAVARMIAKPVPQLVVPRRLTAQLRLMGLIPDPVKRAVARYYGLDTLFLDFDRNARKGYDSRIRA